MDEILGTLPTTNALCRYASHTGVLTVNRRSVPGSTNNSEPTDTDNLPVVTTSGNPSPATSFASGSFEHVAIRRRIDTQEPQPQEQQQQQQQSRMQQLDRFNNMNEEQKIHFIAHKVFKDASLKQWENLFLNEYIPQGPNKDLLKTAIEKLKKPKLDNTEKSIVELYLSSIVNNINLITQEQLGDILVGSDLVLYKMNAKTEELFDQISAQANDIDGMLKIILQEKLALLQSKKRPSEEYTMLSIVEKIIENLGFGF